MKMSYGVLLLVDNTHLLHRCENEGENSRFSKNYWQPIDWNLTALCRAVTEADTALRKSLEGNNYHVEKWSSTYYRWRALFQDMLLIGRCSACIERIKIIWKVVEAWWASNYGLLKVDPPNPTVNVLNHFFDNQKTQRTPKHVYFL